MKQILGLLLVLGFYGCNSSIEKEEIQVFRLPVVFQDSITTHVKFIKKNWISAAWIPPIGKSEFTDSLLVPVRETIDTLTYKSRILTEKMDSLGLGCDGLEIYPDYSTTLSRISFDMGRGKYYPVHLVNQTPSTKIIKGKDRHIFAIQEACNEHGVWFPIEGKGFDFCGNGSWNLKINSKEFLTVLFPKYQGDYKTKLRVRIKNGSTVYVSQPFDGVINKNQFLLDKDHYYYNYLVENPLEAVSNWFYGAKPLELWDEDFGKSN